MEEDDAHDDGGGGSVPHLGLSDMASRTDEQEELLRALDHWVGGSLLLSFVPPQPPLMPLPGSCGSWFRHNLAPAFITPLI